MIYIVWNLATEQAEQGIRGEQSAQQHIEYAEDRIDEKCLMLDPIPMRDCIHNEIETARDHDRANQDLDAQQQMAFFTKIMGWTAGGGLILGGISIFVIIATLREMGRTNQIMRDQQRPWLLLEGQASENISVCISNVGRDVARNVSVTILSQSRIGEAESVNPISLVSGETVMPGSKTFGRGNNNAFENMKTAKIISFTYLITYEYGIKSESGRTCGRMAAYYHTDTGQTVIADLGIQPAN